MAGESTWPPKLRCGKGQKCWSEGKQGKSTGSPMMSLKLKKKQKPEEEEVEIEERSTQDSHMNMRDLGGKSGAVSYSGQVKSSGNADYSTAEKDKMKKVEKVSTKARKFFGR